MIDLLVKSEDMILVMFIVDERNTDGKGGGIGGKRRNAIGKEA